MHVNDQGATVKRFFRHPVRAIREPFGTAGLVVAITALILATTGAAVAASGLNGKQKKEVEKIAKQFAGKQGAAGAPGATGAPGSVGAAGGKGEKGDAGTNGTNGSAGSPGTPGKEGSPWPAGGTLPSGKTETGTWAISATDPAQASTVSPYASISFPIPLPQAGEPESAFAFNQEKTEAEDFGTSGCSGTVEEPTAPPGKLCVYTQFELGENVGALIYEVISPFKAYGVSGAIMKGPGLHPTEIEPFQSASLEAFGTWAVTAP
jgi:hypothetical protein